MPALRNNGYTDDPRLDRLPQFDEKSRSFPIRAAAEAIRPRSFSWRVNPPYVIDQGREGACVGFAVTNELQAWPAEVRPGSLELATRFAREHIYWEAQRIDPWPGGAYPGAGPFMEGTSVLAGMKIAQQLGYFREYRWAFGLADLVHGLGRNGPAVLGIDWYDSMYRPQDNWVRVSGSVVGGHAILARAVRIVWAINRAMPGSWQAVDLDTSYVVLRNSWGAGWGNGGDAKISLRDLGTLLDHQGEGVFAVGRRTQP
jgi:hypothetical protein